MGCREASSSLVARSQKASASAGAFLFCIAGKTRCRHLCAKRILIRGEAGLLRMTGGHSWDAGKRVRAVARSSSRQAPHPLLPPFGRKRVRCAAAPLPTAAMPQREPFCRSPNRVTCFFVFWCKHKNALPPPLRCGCAAKKPPLCKGRWPSAARTEGLLPVCAHGNNPPVMASPCQPPLHKGALGAQKSCKVAAAFLAV